MKELRFMGHGDLEAFRCRVYDVAPDDNRVAFVEKLATVGVLDCAAYDEWISALKTRGWVAWALEPNPDGPGRVMRWTLSEYGRSEWARIKGER